MLENNADGYCLDCGGKLERSPDQSVAACSHCGREFSWLEPSDWAQSYWGTKAAVRQAGGAAVALAVVFAMSAAGEDSPRWLAAFVVSTLLCAGAARFCLR